MKYLSKRTLEDCCIFCGKEFHITKHVNEHIKFLDKTLSFYQFKCAGEDHLIADYVSLYMSPTFYRRITCTNHPDILQLNLDFVNQKSEIVIQLDLKVKTIQVPFDSIINDCESLDKLIEKLETYQVFS